MNKAIIAAIVLVVVFLFGFVPQYAKVNHLETELRQARQGSTSLVLTPIRSSDSLWATGEIIKVPLSSNPMKPLSNRWSMLSVSRAYAEGARASNRSRSGWRSMTIPARGTSSMMGVPR